MNAMMKMRLFGSMGYGVRLVTLLFASQVSAQIQSVEVVAGSHTSCADAVEITAPVVNVRMVPPGSGLQRTLPSIHCVWLRVCFVEPPENVECWLRRLGTGGQYDNITGYLFPEAHCQGATCPMFPNRPLPSGVVELGSSPAQTISVVSGVYYLYFEFDPAVVDEFELRISNYFQACDPAPLDCPSCLSTFSPLPGEHYRVSAWVSKEGLAPGATTVFENGSPYIKVECPPGTDLLQDLRAVGPVIDGWQLIEGTFTMPMPGSGPTTLLIDLGAVTGVSYFDDVRIHPDDASVKSFVYDPRDLRFVAELDERHFAMFYEYDAEGRLVRVKKETERGVMTIKETRQNTAKLVAP